MVRSLEPRLRLGIDGLDRNARSLLGLSGLVRVKLDRRGLEPATIMFSALHVAWCRRLALERPLLERLPPATADAHRRGHAAILERLDEQEHAWSLRRSSLEQLAAALDAVEQLMFDHIATADAGDYGDRTTPQ